MRISQVCGFLTLVLSAQLSQASELIYKTVSVSDARDRIIEITQTLRPNKDGSFTLLKIEPEQEANAFFDRACKEEVGPEARFIRVNEGETIVSESTVFGYVCQSES
ncbi:hypothetical protein ACFOEK_08300 [Litoribrevibacter euphylliae]|uniref:Uncharacterized protein n=1 Tax=Litoribrevibacter euphylliae TaxID=1834034 RepID=A0ABV7HFU8_9GAMM